MTSYAHIKRCIELTDRDIASAIGTMASARALVEHLVRLAKPADGAPKLLLVFAKIAAEEVDWLEGPLRVELSSTARGTRVDALTGLGQGMNERLFPAFEVSVPITEFARGIERVPHMIAPLRVVEASEQRLALSAEGEPAARAPGAESTRTARGANASIRAALTGTTRSEPPLTHPLSVPRTVPARSGRTLRPGVMPGGDEQAPQRPATVVPPLTRIIEPQIRHETAPRVPLPVKPPLPRPSAPRPAPRGAPPARTAEPKRAASTTGRPSGPPVSTGTSGRGDAPSNRTAPSPVAASAGASKQKGAGSPSDADK